MNCTKCYFKRKKIVGSISKKTITVGTITIPNIIYYKCTNPQCEIIVYPPGEGQKIFDYIKKQENTLISKTPISEFLDISEACKLLNISKHTLKKNNRIKRGLLLSFNIGRNIFYLKKSIIQFKNSGYINGKCLI